MSLLQRVFSPTESDIAKMEKNKALGPFKIEEYDCLKMFLDDKNVPIEQGGQKLSLVGRVELYAMAPIRIGTDNICPISKEPCEDETCAPGSECNISGDSQISFIEP